MIDLPHGYVFTGFDSFSGVNDALAAEMRQRFSPELAELKLRDSRRIARGVVMNAPVANLPHAVLEHRTPAAAIRRRLFTRYMFEHRSEVARAAVTARRPDFTLQTQTIFDASVPGVPTFIYTDHTARAHQRYLWPAAAAEANTRYLDLEAAAYANSEMIFVSSLFAANSLIQQYGISPERVEVVGSGVNLTPPATCPERRRPVRQLLFIGLEWERKGGPELLRAFRRLRAEHRDLELTIVGCRPHITGPGVTVLGPINAAEIPVALLKADLFVMPSWLEPSAGVYLEASAYGLPILATNVGGTPDRVLQNRTGLLSEPGDVDALVANARQMIDNPDRSLAMGVAGHQLITNEFTWPRVGQMIAASIVERLQL